MLHGRILGTMKDFFCEIAVVLLIDVSKDSQIHTKGVNLHRRVSRECIAYYS